MPSPKAFRRFASDSENDLALPELPREKVLATIVQLLEDTAIRVGNDEYAKDNNSYGLTTLRNKHAKVEGSNVRFSFRGKSGVRQAIDLRDRRLAKIIRQCQDLPGQQLFEYVDDDGGSGAIDSADVNDYIREISGEEFSAKDFRTWAGTVTCAMLLARTGTILGNTNGAQAARRRRSSKTSRSAWETRRRSAASATCIRPSSMHTLSRASSRRFERRARAKGSPMRKFSCSRCYKNAPAKVTPNERAKPHNSVTRRAHAVNRLSTWERSLREYSL